MNLEEIQYRTYNMKVGERLDIDLRDLYDSGIRGNWLTGESALDRIKSNIVGSAWCYKFHDNPFRNSITIEKIESDGKRRHVDYDRQWMYDKNPDGTYDLRESERQFILHRKKSKEENRNGH